MDSLLCYLKGFLVTLQVAADDEQPISVHVVPGIGPAQPLHQSTVHRHLQPQRGHAQRDTVPKSVQKRADWEPGTTNAADVTTSKSGCFVIHNIWRTHTVCAERRWRTGSAGRGAAAGLCGARSLKWSKCWSPTSENYEAPREHWTRHRTCKKTQKWCKHTVHDAATFQISFNYCCFI